MDLELTGKSAIVTGASAGIGLGIAQLLTEEGVRVVLVGRREGLLREAAAELSKIGKAEPIVIAQDLSAHDAGKTLAAKATALAGQIDILVNNAGISEPMAMGASEESWAKAYAMRVVSARHLAEALVPGMEERGFGRIINIGGTFELHGPINASAVMNAARTVYHKGLSNAVAKNGVTINTISPGIVDSEQIRRNFSTPETIAAGIRMIPAGKFGKPRDVAVLVALLASPLGGYITGELICVDGGMRRFAF